MVPSTHGYEDLFMRGDGLFSESWKYHQESREYCVPSFQRDSGKPQNPHIEQIKPIFGTGFNTPKEIFFFKKVDTLWKDWDLLNFTDL